MTRRLLASIALVGLLVAGCGDDDATPAPGDDATVVASGLAFDPGTIQVPAGEAVTWANDDNVGHTVTAGDPGAPDPDAFDEQLPQGGSAEVTFEEPGTFAYHCAIHPSMTGEVVVE